MMTILHNSAPEPVNQQQTTERPAPRIAEPESALREHATPVRARRRQRLVLDHPPSETVYVVRSGLLGIEALPAILKQVSGIGAILIGEGDLSQELGHPRQYEHPEVLKWMARVVETCKSHNVVVGHPHVDANNVERILAEGYRFLMAAPVRSYAALDKGLKLAGRA